MQKDNYDNAVKVIKSAILKAQFQSLKSVNEVQLVLYFAIGKYISVNTRNGNWGENAIDIIGNKLEKELPGLRGYSTRNIRDMRIFYEQWQFFEKVPNNNLEPAGAEFNNRLITNILFPIEEFASVGFTLHRTILSKVKKLDERIFYIKRCASEKYTRNELLESINRDDFHHQGQITNNFNSTISDSNQVLKAVMTFKDEYLLNMINTEELNIRDKLDIDERIIENGIIHNIKKFILTFGKDFAFIGNQYHLDAFGVDQYIDLLFFNRELNSLVAIELKTGEFKTSYLGQLSGYLSVLTKFEKKEHENPPIGIILCKGMDKPFVDFVINDYTKPMGVATYKDMSDKIKRCLPSVDDLIDLINKEE